MRIATRALASALLLLCGAAQAVEVQFGSLRMELPEGFVLKSPQPPFELAGPDGVRMLVSVFRVDPNSSEKPAPVQADLVASGERMLASNGQRAGKVVLPPKSSSLADNTIMLSAASDTSGLFSKGYFLQFALVSPQSRLAYFTFEGKGEVEASMARYSPLFASVRWEP
jgi:hypothetical protein